MTRYGSVLWVMVVVGVGCSGRVHDGSGADGSFDPDGEIPAGDARADVGADAAPPVDAAVTPDAGGDGCGAPVASGDMTWTLTHDGRERTFHVHVPPGYDPQTPAPVVVNFHGRNSNAQQQILLTGLNATADAEGFVAVHPEGVGQTWNAGLCCGEAMNLGVDDVGFTRALLDRLQAELCVDPQRIFATGISNGGFMAHRLGCELADRIAAFSSVAGPNAMLTCTPSRPVPVLHFHGTADTIVPYDGFAGQMAVVPTMQAWAGRNSCNAQSAIYFQQAEVSCEEWSGCADNASVRLCTITGGGHQWPGGFTIPGLGYNTSVISATQRSWDFFAVHPMP